MYTGAINRCCGYKGKRELSIGSSRLGQYEVGLWRIVSIALATFNGITIQSIDILCGQQWLWANAIVAIATEQ